MKQLFALHTCRLWSPEAAHCKDSEEALKCGLGGAEDPPLEWALRKFWHCGLVAGLESCKKMDSSIFGGKNTFILQGLYLLQAFSSLEAGPSTWTGRSGIWRRSKELWQELDATVLSQLLALCNVSGSPLAGAHSVYQNHVPVVVLKGVRRCKICKQRLQWHHTSHFWTGTNLQLWKISCTYSDLEQESDRQCPVSEDLPQLLSALFPKSAWH